MKRVREYYSNKFVHNKYNHLLIGMIVLFLMAPLYLQTGLKFPLIMFWTEISADNVFVFYYCPTCSSSGSYR
jgi:hypothetical protein